MCVCLECGVIHKKKRYFEGSALSSKLKILITKSGLFGPERVSSGAGFIANLRFRCLRVCWVILFYFFFPRIQLCIDVSVCAVSSVAVCYQIKVAG